MKSIKLNLLIFLFCAIILYLLLIIYTYLDFDNQFEKRFNNIDSLKIYKKYSKVIHHIREEEQLDNFFKDNQKEDLLFTYLNDKNKNSENLKILLQGDSWIEQINTKNNNFFSYKLFQNFGEKFNVTFINGGISSYSPSLMNVQIKLLQEDFDIYPDIIVAFIDQINFGDELCRYKDKKVFDGRNLIRINPETFLQGEGWYNYSEKVTLTEIYYNKKNNFLKVFDLVNYKFISRIERLSKITSLKISNIFSQKKIEIKKCYWSEIENYLINPSKEDENYFRQSIVDYINFSLRGKNLKKLIIVTFPLKDQLLNLGNKKYKINISTLIDDLIKNNKDFNSVSHLNFTKILQENANLIENIGWLDDQIHLNAYSHGNLFTNGILEEVKKYLKNN